MEEKDKILDAIKLLREVYDANNCGDTFSVGWDCGQIAAVLTILRSIK